jgi:methylglutaconyl-CoA hydratase
MWRNAEWARRKGLYAEVHPTPEGMEESITRLCNTLAHSGTEAMHEIKKISWSGTDHWDTLLEERAAISGRLVLSDESRKAVAAFRKK